MPKTEESDQKTIDDLLGQVNAELDQLEEAFVHPGTPQAKPEASDTTNDDPQNNTQVAPPVAAPKEQGDSIEIDGQKYSLADIKAWKENTATAQQLAEWQAKLTQEQQTLKSKGRDIRKEISDLKAEAYDEDKQKMLELLEMQAEQLENQQKFMDQAIEAREYNEARDYVSQAKAELEGRYNTKLPDVDSPEFKKIVELSQIGNKLEMGYLLYQQTLGKTKDPAPKPKLEALDGNPPRETDLDDDVVMDEGMRKEAQRAGIPLAKLKAAMAFGRSKAEDL